MKLLILLFVLFFYNLHAITLNDSQRDFALRYGGAGKHLTGDIAATGGAVICQDDGSNNCNWNYTGAVYNLNPLIVNDDTTNFTNNSSRAPLTLPADINGSDIVWAGLYWQGHIFGAGTLDTSGYDSVKMLDSLGTLHNITSTQNDFYSYTNASTGTGGSNGYRFFYQSFADVTDIVKNSYSSINKNFTVGEITTTTTKDSLSIQEPAINDIKVNFGNWGGWSLVVVYEGDFNLYPFKNIAVYDGFKFLIPDFGGGTSQLTIDLPAGSFYTPLTGDVNSRLTVFAAGAEKSIYKDNLEIWKDSNNDNIVDSSEWEVITNTLNPGPVNSYYNQFNDSITFLGNHINPARIFNPGIDVDTYNTTNLIANKQTTTKIRASMTSNSSSADQTFMGHLGISVELFAPKLCYDYAYSQNGKFFTEDNNGSYNVTPHLSGDLFNTEPILTRVFIRNEQEGSTADKITLYVEDLNTTQVIFPTNSSDLNLSRTEPNTVTYTLLPTTDIYTHTTSDLTYKFSDTLNFKEGVYTEFFLHPQASGPIDVPLNMAADINYTFGTQSFGIPKLPLRDKIPICSGSNFSYQPTWGKFNVEDSNLAETGKYNLYTQVANRAFNVNVVSYDESSTTTIAPTTAMVAVDMIDASAYHDVEISCSDPKSSISPRVWVFLTNESSKLVDVGQAISDQFFTSISDFYGTAKENVAFRVSYLLNEDGSGDPIAYTDNLDGTYKVDGFTTVVGETCSIDPRTGLAKEVRKPNDNGWTNQTSVACGNASKIDEFTLKQCFECLYQSNVVYSCSRDNFSIRPEAFKVDIADNYESIDATDPTLTVPYTADLSAGYNYRYDVTATSHIDEIAIKGYTQSFTVPALDHNITYYWRPNGAVVTGCNDTTDKYPTINLLDGAAINQQNSSNNVGRYELEMRDAAWTKVDQNPSHHIADTTHFNAYDCTLNKNFVPLSTTPLNNTNVGCTISSSHTNLDRPTIIYSDYNVTVHPYDFNLSTVTFNKGISSTPITANDYVYMNNILVDSNMSVRYSGQIRAVGANTVPLSNFVADCYAKDVNLELNTSALPATPLFNYRLRETNTSNGVVFNDTNGSNGGNPALPAVVIPASNFLSSSFGVSDMALNVNFDRNVTGAINPIQLTYDSFNVSCSNSSDCESYADMSATHLPDSNITSIASVTHIYGRVHTPRQRVANPNPANAANAQIPLYYEFYCDGACNIGTFAAAPALSPFALLSQDDVRWYNQELHNVARDGNATATQARSLADDVLITTKVINAGAQSATYTYNGNKGYPYKATIELSAPVWLLYNRFDPAATVNDFELEFFSSGQFAGEDASGVSMDGNTSINVNRRIQW